MMLWLLDKLILAYMYLNVLSPTLEWHEVSVSKCLMGCIIVIYSIEASVRAIIPSRREVFYIFISLGGMLALAAISSIRGNQIENIMSFVVPVAIIFAIPVFQMLFREYGADRYVRHLFLAILLLALTIVLIYVFTIQNRELGFMLNDSSKNFMVTYRGMDLSFADLGSIRVVTKTGAFLPFGILMAYYYFKVSGRRLLVVMMALLVFALYLNQTYALMVSVGVAIFILFMSYTKDGFQRLWYAVGLTAVLGVMLLSYLSSVMEYKGMSIDIKKEQVSSAMELFTQNPFTGVGLGYLYHDMDSRGTEDTCLEVSYAAILASTGMIGAAIYGYLFLCYPVIALAYARRNKLLQLLLLGQLSILVASFGNPYMVSGGIGLFFVVMIAAYVEYLSRGTPGPYSISMRAMA